MAKVDIIGFSVRELEKICNGNFVVDINFENEDFLPICKKWVQSSELGIKKSKSGFNKR